MKGVLEIHKSFWYINSVLIAILVYVVVGFILTNNAGESNFAYPIPIKEKVEIIPSKRPLLKVEHRIILERNIFCSSGFSPAKASLQRTDDDVPISVIKAQFRLCATVTGNSQIACAVIEDMKTRRQDIYKAGEMIREAMIEEIGRSKIVLLYGGRL